MKTRLISAAVLLVIGIGVMVGIFTPVFTIFIALLSVVSAGEIMNVAGVRSKLVKIPAMIFSAVIPVYLSLKGEYIHSDFPEGEILCLYVILMVAFMLKTNKQTKFEQLAITLYGSVFIPYAFSGALALRDTYATYTDTYSRSDSVYLVLFALFCAFFTDSFAYFVGRKFGKHKMAPVVSPKKSVEGAIGGLVLSVAFNLAAFAVFRELIVDKNTSITYVFIAVMSLILSVISMLGDLSASLLKRNFGIKDFGNIMPGHGGVMDRFDSCVFVLPVLSAAVKLLNM